MQDITNDHAKEIAIRRAENENKTEEEILDIKEEYEDLISKDEMQNRAICVYIKNQRICYCYGNLDRIYKRLVEFIYKVARVNLNKKGMSIYLYLYIVNKYKLDITEKWFELSEFIREDVNVYEVPNKIPKSKILFSKYRAKVNIKRSDLEKDEIPINNYLTFKMKVNGETIFYRIGKGKFRIKDPKEYYFPIKSMYNDDYAMHIRIQILFQ